MIIIRTIQVSGRFSYLWLKHVHGVNLREHCAHSLIGDYNASIRPSIQELHNVPLPDAPYHYLCGVSSPYVWSRNFHLAFREKEGSILRVSRHGIEIEIENAEEITFSEEDIDPADPHIGHKSYRTCRNWQFAYKISKLL